MVVTLDRDDRTGLLEMKPVRLMKWVIETLGLDNGMYKGGFKPAEAKLLVNDEDGESVSGTFSYSSIWYYVHEAGILVFLS